jgi:chorismate mutase/prephenate dehydrogenase
VGAEVAVNEPSLRADLDRIRKELDLIDEKLIQLLARRLDVGLEAAAIKNALHMPIHDPEREATALAQAKKWARDARLPESEVDELMRRVISLSRNAQIARRE